MAMDASAAASLFCAATRSIEFRHLQLCSSPQSVATQPHWSRQFDCRRASWRGWKTGKCDTGVRKRSVVAVYAGKHSRKLEGRKLRVAVVGGGPAGSSAAETLSKAGIESFLIERKLDNAKPCGGAIPFCMVDEFDLPLDIIERRVTKMKMISPSNIAVDVGKLMKDY
eukprot:c24248_g2_i1 orf=99-602(+)